MDYDTIIEEIEANDENLAEIEDAFIVFATNLYTTAQSELRVLFELLSNFGADAQVTRAVFEADNQSLSTNVVNILEGYFNASFQFNWMETTTITGVLSQTGTYTSTVDIIPLDPDVPDQGVESFFTLSYQISDTEYVELVLHGPMLYHTIKTTVGSYKVKTIQLSSDPAEQVDFNIPLTLDSLEELPYKDKEEVIYRSMTLCIYASSYNYLEWYETARFTSDFSIAVKIIAIVILIYSLGTAATVSAALWALASQVLIQIAIAYALEYILTEYGAGSVQGAAAIAAYIYIAYITGDTSGLSDAFDLLRLATITIDVSLINTAVELEALDLEIGAFEKDAEEKEEELQTAWDYLDVAEYNPLYLKRITQTYPDESPGDYYTRTIHTGNPGVNALNQIETYVENLLLLPELDIYSLDPSIKDL